MFKSVMNGNSHDLDKLLPFDASLFSVNSISEETFDRAFLHVSEVEKRLSLQNELMNTSLLDYS